MTEKPLSSDMSGEDLEKLVKTVLHDMNKIFEGDLSSALTISTDTVWGQKLHAKFSRMREALATRMSDRETTLKAEIEEKERLTQALSNSEAQYKSLFEQTKDALAETRALYLTAKSLISIDSLPNLLDLIVDSIARALPANRVTLITFENEIVTNFVAAGAGVDNVVKVSYRELQEGLSGWVLREQKPVLSPKDEPDPRESPDVQRRRRETDCGAILVVPLLFQDRILGTLTAINTPDEKDFTQRDLNLMATMANQAATTIENARLYEHAQQEIEERLQTEQALKQAEEKLARRATELETVTQVSTDVSQILDTAEMLQRVVDLTKNSFNLYHTHIYLLDEDKTMLNLAAGAGDIGRRMMAEGWLIPLDRKQSLVAQAARTKEGIIVNNVRQEASYFQNPLLPDTQSEMAIPLVAGDRILGVLDVQANTLNRFTAEDIKIHSILAAQIAVALQNARLFEMSQTTLTETEALYKISASITGVENLSTLLELVVKKLAEVLPSTWAMLHLLDLEKQEILRFVINDPRLETVYKGEFYELMDGLTGCAIRDMKPVLSPKGEPDPRESITVQQLRQTHYIGSVLVVPLRYQDKILGTMTALNHTNSPSFADRDIDLMMAMANQISAAIENRILLEQTRRRATRERTIRQITEKMRNVTSLEALVKTAAEELGQHLSAGHAVVNLGIPENNGQNTDS